LVAGFVGAFQADETGESGSVAAFQSEDMRGTWDLRKRGLSRDSGGKPGNRGLVALNWRDREV
jgi:hypothetical protein